MNASGSRAQSSHGSRIPSRTSSRASSRVVRGLPSRQQSRQQGSWNFTGASASARRASAGDLLVGENSYANPVANNYMANNGRPVSMPGSRRSEALARKAIQEAEFKAIQQAEFEKYVPVQETVKAVPELSVPYGTFPEIRREDLTPNSIERRYKGVRNPEAHVHHPAYGRYIYERGELAKQQRKEQKEKKMFDQKDVTNVKGFLMSRFGSSRTVNGGFWTNMNI